MKMRFVPSAIILAPVLLMLNFTFYHGEMKWRGDRPVVLFAIDYSITDYFPLDEEGMETLFRNLALGIFWDGRSNFALKSEGLRPVSLSGMGDVSCDEHLSSMGMSGIVVEEDADPDCTGTTCVFVWNCEGRNIVQGDIQLNMYGQQWDATDQGLAVLKKEILHAFGHVAGLDHCGPGLTREQCEALLPEEGGEPGENTALYPFVDGRSSAFSRDEQRGLVALYGANNLPLPFEGPYRITPDEISTILNEMRTEVMMGYTGEEGRREGGLFLLDLFEYNRFKSGKGLRAQADEFFSVAGAQTEKFDLENLGVQKIILAGALYTGSRLKHDIEMGYLRLDPELIDYMIENHLALRRRTFDRIRALGSEPQ